MKKDQADVQPWQVGFGAARQRDNLQGAAKPREFKGGGPVRIQSLLPWGHFR
jgi:hypothetical protein